MSRVYDALERVRKEPKQAAPQAISDSTVSEELADMAGESDRPGIKIPFCSSGGGIREAGHD